jgi:putative NADH-flavin reductase
MVVSPLTMLLSKSVKDHQRLIVVFGAGLMLVEKNTMLKEMDKDNDTLKNQRADHWEAFTNLLPLDINYLMICPTWVIEGDADGNYLTGDTYFPKSDKIQILSGNVGHFIANEIKENKYQKTRIGLVNK